MKSKILPFSLKALTLGTAVLVLTSAGFMLNKVESNNVETSQEVCQIKDSESVAKSIKSLKEAKTETTNEEEVFFVGPNNYAGYVSSIIYDNKSESKNIVIVGFENAGLYKSLDRGNTWKKINKANKKVLKVSSIYQTSKGDVYVSTGNVKKSVLGQGLYVSKDSDNFELVKGTGSWTFISKVLIDEKNNIIYIGTDEGLKYSSNNGDSWETAKDTEDKEIKGIINDFELTSDGTIIFSVFDGKYLTADNNVYIKKSSSKTFAKISKSSNDAAHENNLIATIGAKSIRFAASKTDAKIVYATSIYKSGRMKYLYLSEDAGKTWKSILDGQNKVISPFSNERDAGNGVNSCLLTVDDVNPYKLYIGSFNIWTAERKTDQKNFTWKKVSSMQETSAKFLHWNINCLDQDVEGKRLIIGTSSGIWECNSEKFTFVAKNNNLQSVYVSQINHGKDLGQYFLGTKYNNALYFTPKTGDKNAAIKQYVYSLNNDKLDQAYFCIESSIMPEIKIFGMSGKNINRINSEDGTAPHFVNDTVYNGLQRNESRPLYMELWETDEFEYPIDTVIYTNKSLNFKRGDKVTAFYGYNANTVKAPVVITLKEDLPKDDTIKALAPYMSRIFAAAGNILVMSQDVTNLTRSTITKSYIDPTYFRWYTIASFSTDQSNEKHTTALKVAADGNTVWVGQRYVYKDTTTLARVTNILPATTRETADIYSDKRVVKDKFITLPESVREKVISSVSIDPTDSNVVMVTFEGFGDHPRVILSTNGLEEEPTFTDVTGNLPKIPVNASIIEMDSKTNKAFVGTAAGLYMTDNLFASTVNWKFVATPFNDSEITDIKQQLTHIKGVRYTQPNPAGGEPLEKYYPGNTNYGAIAIGTKIGAFATNKYLQAVGTEDERGLYVKSSTINAKIYPNPTANTSNVEINLADNADVKIEVYSYNGRLVLTNDHSLKSGLNNISLDVSNLENGAYIVRLNDGVNSVSTRMLVIR
ncbi:MAG: T9SS type A sorting domain-containing protein [Hyphomicrobiales bacterium]